MQVGQDNCASVQAEPTGRYCRPKPMEPHMAQEKKKGWATFPNGCENILQGPTYTERGTIFVGKT